MIKYIIQIKNLKKLKIIKRTENSIINNNINNSEQTQKKKSTKLKTIKYNKNKNYKKFDLNKKEIKEIINNNHYIEIKHNDEETHISTIYKYKNKCKNFIYYICKERNKCNGRGKVDINEKKFIITENCNIEVKHNNMIYEEFVNLMKNNNIIKYLLMKEKFKNFTHNF